jgi:hypothetical protein
MLDKTALGLVVVTLFAASSVRAQEEEASGAEGEAMPAAEATAVPPAAEEAAPVSADAGRFRFGIDGTVGLESVSVDGAQESLSGLMYGIDLRLGWQFSKLLAVYAQPHLSFGSLGTGVGGVDISGGTGTIVATVMGEVTFIDRIFAGAGFGYGVFNNPSGPALELRAGGYPLMGVADNGIRRKGLMLSIDFRTVFLDGATGIMFMGCVGYEAF